MKRLFIVTALVLAMVMAFSGVALAETKVEVDWDGGGWVGGNVTAGNDAFAKLESFGAAWHTGSFTALDANNNPYNYGVDDNTFTMKTEIVGGGYANMFVERTDARVSMYGPAGQQSYIGVITADGNATLANRSRTNYADMIDGNYDWQSNNHITVTGSSMYKLDRWMDGGTGNSAGILAWGSGDAKLTAMSSEAKNSQVRLGWGAGCHTNARFNASGSGVMNLWADSKATATTALLPGLSAQKFDILVNWTNGTLDIGDYSTTAK